MVSVFDLEKLRALLKDFYAISHTRITVFDENLNELVSYPEKVAPYCAVIRGTYQGFDACMACDRTACQKAAKKHNTYIYRCHAGLTEAVTPLYVGAVLVGYLLFGHVFSYPSHEEGWAVIEKRCEPYHVNTRMLKEAVFAAAYFLFRVPGRKETNLRRTGRDLLNCLLCGIWGMAMAAVLLGADEALGIDIDDEAVRVANENIVKNRLEGRISIMRGNLMDGIDYEPDIIVANLMADLVIMLSPAAAKQLRPGGVYITSGILDIKEDIVKKAIEDAGFDIIEVLADGEWRAITASRR